MSLRMNDKKKQRKLRRKRELTEKELNYLYRAVPLAKVRDDSAAA